MTIFLLWAALVSLILLPSYAPFMLASLALTALYLVDRGPRLRREIGVLLAAFIPLAWVVLVSLLRLQDAQGIVIAVTLLAGGTAACVGMLDARSISPERVARHATYAALVLTALGAVWLAVGPLAGLGAITSRYASGFSAIVGAYMLASNSEWWPRGRVVVGLGLTVVVALLGARTATAVLLLAFAYSLYRLARAGHAAAAIGTVIVGVASVVALAATPTLAERYLGGDRAYTIGGLTINTMGRAAAWPQVLADAREAWLLGHGGGRSAVVTRAVWGLDHPHNEVLRILEDFGVVGLIIVLAILFWIVRRLLQGGMATRGSLAALAASLLLSLTDNTIIYSIWVVPTALFVGFGLGVARDHPRLKRRRPWSPIPSVRASDIRETQPDETVPPWKEPTTSGPPWSTRLRQTSL